MLSAKDSSVATTNIDVSIKISTIQKSKSKKNELDPSSTDEVFVEFIDVSTPLHHCISSNLLEIPDKSIFCFSK